MISRRILAALLLAFIAVVPARARQDREASALSRQDRKLLEWFNKFGYAPNLAKTPLVLIKAPASSGSRGEPEEQPELGFLLSVREGEFRILTLSLKTRTFR